VLRVKPFSFAGRVFFVNFETMQYGNHETVKVVLDASYPYSDFMGWFESLDKFEKEVWTHLAKSPDRTEQNTILLTKKAMELYCLEMDVDYIPNSDDYLETIFRKLTTNLVMASLIEQGMVELKSGKVSMIDEREFALTERGKKFMSKIH
jgi:hypothetical protein